jgi:hypothetical protein
LNNHIWNNPQEFFAKLNEISGIEYKTIKEHFSHAKTIEKVIDYVPFKTSFIPAREPPNKW